MSLTNKVIHVFSFSVMKAAYIYSHCSSNFSVFLPLSYCFNCAMLSTKVCLLSRPVCAVGGKHQIFANFRAIIILGWC